MTPDQESCKRFKERIMRIGFFHEDQIEEVRDPTRDSLEKKLKSIEQAIEAQGHEHTLNTFLLVFYSGPA